MPRNRCGASASFLPAGDEEDSLHESKSLSDFAIHTSSTLDMVSLDTNLATLYDGALGKTAPGLRHSPIIMYDTTFGHPPCAQMGLSSVGDVKLMRSEAGQFVCLSGATRDGQARPSRCVPRTDA